MRMVLTNIISMTVYKGKLINLRVYLYNLETPPKPIRRGWHEQFEEYRCK